MATVPTVSSRDKMAARGPYAQLRVSQFPTIRRASLFTALNILNSFSTILFISARNLMKFRLYLGQMFENVTKSELNQNTNE